MLVLIPDVVCESERKPDHEDARRTLCTMFNGDLGEFRAAQVKCVFIKADGVLGGHFHRYHELFYLLDGEASFVLQHTCSLLKQQLVLRKGSRVLIPPFVAHAAKVKAGTILVGCTEVPYRSAVENDQPYEVKFD